MPERVLVTGSAGSVGRMIVPLLAAQLRVRGFDLVATPGADSVVGSIFEPAELDAALRGVDAIVHLAGIPGEAPWGELLRVNVDGTQRVLDAARRGGVARVILASSNHAVGFTERAGATDLPSDARARPDTFYGVSKAAMEALGSYYHHKHGLDVVSIRIGTAEPQPSSRRALTTWISPRDLAGLVTAAVRAPGPLDAVVWGISDNTGSPFSLDSARALGWEPLDDAARAVAEGDTDSWGDLAPESEADRRYVGGDFTTLA
jgi:uronate dehydrogenase